MSIPRRSWSCAEGSAVGSEMWDDRPHDPSDACTQYRCKLPIGCRIGFVGDVWVVSGRGRLDGIRIPEAQPFCGSASITEKLVGRPPMG